MWQRFVNKQEDELEARESIAHIVVARARPKKMQEVDPKRPTWGWFSYEGQGIQDATSVMLDDDYMVLTHDWALVCQGPDFGDARLHAPKGNPKALDFDDAKAVGQGGQHRPWMQRYDLHDRKKEYALRMVALETKARETKADESDSMVDSVGTSRFWVGSGLRRRVGNAKINTVFN